MAKKVRDATLDSRAARAKLKVSAKPYFRRLDANLHVGYRKGKRGGVWVLRRYLGEEKYAVEAIGDADDMADADGTKTLTFDQAQTKSRERVKEIAEEARIASLGPAITVRNAIESYLKTRDDREAKLRGVEGQGGSDGEVVRGMKRDASIRLAKHVLNADENLADKALAALTTEDLSGWRNSLHFKMAEGSVRRTVNDFKAALNAAGMRHKKNLPPDFRDTVRDGLKTVNVEPAAAREAQVLPDADIRALIIAAWEVDAKGGWEGDLARIVVTLAATGARFSQVIRMTVADVQPNRLMIPASRKGRGKKKVPLVGVPVGEDVLAVLERATAGRKGFEPLFLRPRWEPVGVARWARGNREPWYAAAELTRPWAEIVDRAGMAAGTIPYALRHSSIVRGLREGLPIRLVAALHDTSSAMIEAHYSAHITSALDELAARAIVPLTKAPATVTRIRAGRG